MMKLFSAPAIVTVLSALGVLGIQNSQLGVTPVLEDEFSEDVVQSKNQTLSETLNSLGYDGLSASLLWIDFIQYYGGSASIQSPYASFNSYLTNIVESEPRFVKPYDIATSVFAYRAGRPERALELLEYGLDYVSPEINPRAYVLPFEAGTLSFLYFGDGELGRTYYEQAADWYEEAEGESAEQWRELASRLYDNPRSQRVQFDVWSQAYSINPDPDVREIILERLATLGEVRRYPDGRIEVIPPPSDL